MDKQKTQKSNFYLSMALREVPLLLSLEDRRTLSNTYGCFDRNYWGWKFTDFADSRFQEGVCSLALLYANDFEGNYLYKDKRTLDWLLAGMEYWTKLAHRNGSFDEAYPFEQSLAATAFTTFYLGEAFLTLPDEIPAALKEKLRGTFLRAGNWLCKNDEKHGILSNHLAAAAAALYNIHLITGEEKFRQRSNYFLEKIYAHQSPEGWFEEYGAADPGYQTLCAFFLARLWQRTKDDALLERLNKATEFFSYFVHPDHTIAGEYASRNTEFYFPAACEILSERFALAGKIAQFMGEGIESNTAAGLSAMDSYNFFPMLNNYIFAGLNHRQPMDTLSKLPFQENFRKYYPEAGIFIESSEKYYAIAGVSKGGVIKIFDKKKNILAYSDCGYWIRLRNKSVFSSQSLERSKKVSFSDNKIEVISEFSKVTSKIFSPALFILFRIFTLTLARLPVFSSWLKCALVKALVVKKKNINCVLLRSVEFSDEEIHIIDTIRDLDKAQAVSLVRQDKFTAIHMGSAHYFQKSELAAEYFKGDDLLAGVKDKKLIKFEKTIKF